MPRMVSAMARAAGAHRLVLLRHGESEWNKENLFTGWWDADLTELGEAAGGRRRAADGRAGRARPTCVHTSLQTRAIRTAELALARDGPVVDPGAAGLAAQRAPLRRPHRPGQGRDARERTAPSR